MSQTKIHTTHLQRQAVIYIRQSSLQQVEQHTEGRRRQYQLAQRAQALGWPAAQCVVIDEDLGISGAHSHNRPGYQRLISMVALREVGIVLGLEVSRLARNNLDWYRLLELAAAFEALIGDEDGIYDPGDFNDRLLLGLKGTISEVELHQIRKRLVHGKLNKARRGESKLPLPVGLDWDPHTQKPRLAVDQSVRHAVTTVFQLFTQLRSVRGVLHYLRREGLELPYQRVHRGLGRQIAWRRPSYDAIYGLITNPTYAGVYCYGKRERRLDPLTQQPQVRKRPRPEWLVFLPDHHPGYLTLAQFEENQQVLANNRNAFPTSQGAPRRGRAVLQGLVFCQHCGQKMRVRYSASVPYYTCDAAHRRYGDPICNRASARRVDALVEELYLSVVTPHSVDLSLSYDEQLRQESAQVERGWEEKLQRLAYDADLARRRYELVDPENRLVAQTLETEWNQKLLALQAARQAYEAQKPQPYQLLSTLEQIRQVVSQLREYWYASHISSQDKKELLRCLIERVFLQNRGKVIRAQVCWYGGASSELDVPKYLFSSPQVYHRIRSLAKSHTDREIAARLHQEKLTTAKGKTWTARHVMDFRLSNAIPSGFTTNTGLRIPDTGFITSAEAARELGVEQSTIQRWFKMGILSGKHDGGQSPLWIAWNERVRERLSGGATPDNRMVTVRSLCRKRGEKWEEVMAWAAASEHGIFRLRRGSAMRFYILPKEASVQLE